MYEFIVWLKDGRTVTVQANNVLIRPSRLIFRDADHEILASFSDYAGWSKRGNVIESADAGEGAAST